MPHPEVTAQGLAAKPTFETDDMVLLNRSADRNRRGGHFRGGRRYRHAEAAQRTVYRSNVTSELIGGDPVLREITANDSDYEAAIELVRDAFLGHFPNQLLNPIYG
jgi:hypothetical protein